MMDYIKAFVDQDGKLFIWPSKRDKKEAVLLYLAMKMPQDREFTEREINRILESLHTFGDFFLLRRELVEAGLLCRTKDGSRYWGNWARVKELAGKYGAVLPGGV